MATSVTDTSTSPRDPSVLSPSALRASLAHDGYVLIPSLYSSSELVRLRSAALAITELARVGKWPYIRTLPKQFPPWSSDPSEGIWGVQHLMHPDVPQNIRKVFIGSYFSDAIIDVVKAFLGDDEKEATDDELIMELYNLLVRPDKDFELRWHRDDIPPTATPEEELDRLGHRAWHTQWNAALYDDSSLIVVPGSHTRARTQEERDAGPFEKELGGMKIVHMKAGDVVFYNNNILHRGVYKSGTERMTLHGSVGHITGGNGRARNVLQHGVGKWVDRLDLNSLAGDERHRAEGMRKQLVDLGSRSGDVGFSQEG
jgi:hypothetical protein